MSHSWFGHFATEMSGFSKTFPGITPYILTVGAFFWVPFLRDYVMSVGELAPGVGKPKKYMAARERSIG